MNVLGNADLQIFELEHPHLMAIWRTEATMRMEMQCSMYTPPSMLQQMAASAAGLFGGLERR